MHLNCGSTISSNSILTVSLPVTDLKRLDALAKQRRQTRFQLFQETLQTLLDSDEEPQRWRELETLGEQLRSAVEAQEVLLERASVADEQRRF